MFTKRRTIGAGLTLVALVAAGLVYAAWTTNGSGSGYAKAQSAQQLTTVSYGEERPAATGSDEESWRLNRRVELVYR